MSTKLEQDTNFSNLPNLPKNNSFQDYVSNKKLELEEKIHSHPRSSSSTVWVLVLILILTLIALGTFTLSQIRQSNQEISSLRQKNSVAGEMDQASYGFSPISGYGFTILPAEETPEGFELSRKTENSTVFETRSAVFSSYINEKLIGGRKIRSGIEVEVLEYDNQYNQEQFSDLFAKKIGTGFKLVSNEISIPRNFKISRIDPVDKNVGYSYYTAVTTDNYYIIKYYNQSSDISELKNLTRFTENLISWLYLN